LFLQSITTLARQLPTALEAYAHVGLGDLVVHAAHRGSSLKLSDIGFPRRSARNAGHAREHYARERESELLAVRAERKLI
jgi:hypothetical protein